MYRIILIAINVLLLGRKFIFANLPNYELLTQRQCAGNDLLAGSNFTLQQCEYMCTTIYHADCTYFTKKREGIDCWIKTGCISNPGNSVFDSYRKLAFEAGVEDMEVGSVALDEGLTCEGGDLMYLYSNTGAWGPWGIVITIEKCLHLCWAHGSCVAVIYKIDGYRCDLKQSCAVVATSDTTKRVLLVEQKINSSLTAITDMDNATCAAVEKNAMTIVTHSDSTVTFEEIRLHIWGYNLTCDDAASTAAQNMYVMVQWITAQSTETHRFYQACSIESATTENAREMYVYKCVCQGRCNSIYLRAVGDNTVTLCGVQVYSNF